MVLVFVLSANPVVPGVPVRGEGYFPPTLSRQEYPLLGEGYFPPTLSCQEYPMLGEGCFPPNLYWPEYPWRGGHGEGNSCCCTVLIALVRWSKFGLGYFLGGGGWGRGGLGWLLVGPLQATALWPGTAAASAPASTAAAAAAAAAETVASAAAISAAGALIGLVLPRSYQTVALSRLFIVFVGKNKKTNSKRVMPTRFRDSKRVTPTRFERL